MILGKSVNLSVPLLLYFLTYRVGILLATSCRGGGEVIGGLNEIIHVKY